MGMNMPEAEPLATVDVANPGSGGNGSIASDEPEEIFSEGDESALPPHVGDMYGDEDLQRDNDMLTLNALFMYDVDKEAKDLVDRHASYWLYAGHVDECMGEIGKEYAMKARWVPDEMRYEPIGLCDAMIARMEGEQRKTWQDKMNALSHDGNNTKSDYYRLFGEMVREGMGMDKLPERIKERRENAGAVFADVVRYGGAVRLDEDGEVMDGQSAAWSKFYEGKARGVYTEADEASLRKAAAAYEQFLPMIENYTEAGANVLTQASTGAIIYDLLGDDEVARVMFMAAVSETAEAAAADEAQRNMFVRFGREFAAADRNMMAAIMGGHFKPFVSDEEVDRYNDEVSRIRKDTGGSGFSMLPGGMMASRYAAYGREDVRARIAQIAEASGQMQEDGTLRKMTDEERREWQGLNRFRAQLKQAVDGMYDVDGSFWGNALGSLGGMAPQSMLFLVPYVGQAGAFKAGYTEALAGDLADGRSFDEASARAGASALINTAVERIAFGKVGKLSQPLGLDKLMRTKVMGRALGGVYGNTAGRMAMGVGVGVLEETYAEPFAGMVLGGVHNAVAPSEYELDNPWVTFREEVDEMTKPENLMATALYGMLLGGVSVHGQREESAEYRRTMEALTKAGVDEGRAAQIARMEDPLERNREAVKEVGFKLSSMDKEQTKNLTEALSDTYPLMAQMATLGHYYESGRLPRLEEAGTDAQGKKQYRVTENGREGEAVTMSEDVARKYVQSRMEDMVEEEHARLADRFLADAMVTEAAKRDGQFVVEEVDDTMNADYFERMATAAQVKLDAGHARDEVVPEVHPELTLGQLTEQSAVWRQRLNIARHDMEQKMGRKLTDAEWEERKARLASPVNRTRLRAEQTDGRRMRTLLRVARGRYSAMNVLEDVTEDNVVRYMEATGHDLTFFADNLRELGKAMGNEWRFLRELGEGEQYSMLDIVEGLGKVVQGKVLADTAHKANGLPAWVNTFLDMVRRWVEQAAALMKLGEAVNKYLYADKASREKFSLEFREMVEKVAEQDVEFLRELQQERSKEAEERILRAGATGYAPVAEATPTMDAAEAEHGEAVRQEQAAEEAYMERVDEDVSAALEMSSFTNEDGAEEKTLQQQKGELHYVRHGDFESAEVTRDPRAEDSSLETRRAARPEEADAEGRGNAGTADEVGRGVYAGNGELGATGRSGKNQELREPQESSRIRRLLLLTGKVHRFHADASQKAKEKGIYTGELHELTQSDESAALFRECIEAAKVTQGLQGNCVYTYSEEEYAQMRLFLTPDGKAGLALKHSEDGNLDMVSVFKDKTLLDRGEKRVDALISLAIQQGAQKADCYGHHLVKLYGMFGFRAVAKDRFNAEYAPAPMKDEGVMREAFAGEPEAGRPDVVYLVYVGNREGVLDEFDSRYAPDYAETLDYAQGENTYDACVEAQSEAAAQAEKWMRTLPSMEARENSLRRYLQRRRGDFSSAVEDGDVSFAVEIDEERVCRTRKEANELVGRNGKVISLSNKYLELEAEYGAKSEGKAASADSLDKTFAALEPLDMERDDILKIHYTAIGNIVDLFSNAGRMKFERAYKKHETRKGVLHVYSPFAIRGEDGEFEANIELLIHQDAGKKPTVYVLSVEVNKKLPPIIGRSEATFNLPAAAHELTSGEEASVPPMSSVVADIQAEFPEIVKGDFSSAMERMWDESAAFEVDAELEKNLNAALVRGRQEDGKIIRNVELRRTHEVRLSTLPDVLRLMGEPDIPLVMTVHHVRKLNLDHELSVEQMREIVQKLNDPLLVFQAEQQKYLMLLDMEAYEKDDKASRPIICFIERKPGKTHAEYMVSAYPLRAEKYGKVLGKQHKLLYSKFRDEKTAQFSAVAPQCSEARDLVLAVIKGGYAENVATFGDVVKSDFSSAMAYIDEEKITRPLRDAGRSFRGNEAFVQQMLGEMRQCMHKLRKLGGRTRTDREEALATMGSVVQLVKSVRLYMPRGYRFSVAPYVRQLEGLSELATTGRIHLTQKITEADLKRDARELRKMDGEAANGALETGAYAEGEMVDELVREYGDQTLNAVLEAVMQRVADGLRRYAKDEVVKRMAKLLGRTQVKKDKKTGKLKGGLMDAEGYREMDKVRGALAMDAGALADKLASLEARAAKDDLTDEQRDELEADMALYSTFGDVAGMSLEQAAEAYESLRGRVILNRFAWDDKRADIRHARRGVINAVVRMLGRAKPNEYHKAKVNKRPLGKAKLLGDMMMNAPQTLRAMMKVPGLGAVAENIATRMNRAGEMMKTWERERWARLEALSRHCLGKSWRKCMDEMHKQQGTGVAYDRTIWRTVSIRRDYLMELLRMSPEERAREMQRNREAGGVLADAVYSERDMASLEAEMATQRDAGRVRKTIETRYVEEVQHEENLELSKGEALYIILMYEQPTYTARMEAQGYTPEVIAGLREYIGQGWLEFGYGLREMFAEQGDKIAAVYEEVYGVPFPREENYFAARFVVDKVSDNTAEGLLAGMAGQPGVGTGWMKPRVTHNLDVDTNKDALQVFLQAVSLTDAWVATQDIVADLKSYMGDKEFSRTVTAKLGKEAYQNFKDWVMILEMGGVNDTVSMGAGQDMIRRVYSAGAISILGWRVQTWFRQFPAIANGLLGAHDISVGEYLGAMGKLKHGTARMTFSRMLASDFMKNRYATDGDKMKEQAMRGEEKGSRMEPWLDAAMAPMGKIDAGLTAAGLVPVWNVYYERAMRHGCSEAEAEARAWEQTELAANMGSQPMGFLNKAKISQIRNPLARGVLFMLSETTGKAGLVSALWKSGHRKAAARAWLIYGGLNAMMSCLLDALQGDPEEFEKGKWWEYVLSAIYGPLASMPGVSEIVEGLGTAALNGVGYLVGSETMQNAKTRASIGRALIDFKGSYKAVKKLYELLSDDVEHPFYEYTRAASTISRMAGTGLGWMGNAAGYFSMLTSTLMNPLDFSARVWRNAMHYAEE